MFDNNNLNDISLENVFEIEVKKDFYVEISDEDNNPQIISKGTILKALKMGDNVFGQSFFTNADNETKEFIFSFPYNDLINPVENTVYNFSKLNRVSLSTLSWGVEISLGIINKLLSSSIEKLSGLRSDFLEIDQIQMTIENLAKEINKKITNKIVDLTE